MTDRPDICSQDPARAMADLERWLEQELRPRLPARPDPPAAPPVHDVHPVHPGHGDRQIFDRAWQNRPPAPPQPPKPGT